MRVYIKSYFRILSNMISDGLYELQWLQNISCLALVNYSIFPVTKIAVNAFSHVMY